MRASREATAGQDYDDAVAEALTAMQTRIDANAAAFGTAIQLILAANQQAVDEADSDFDSSTASATTVFTTGQQTANATFESAKDQADSLRNSTIAAANTTLQATLQANQSVYHNAVGNASGFDPSVASSDPGFQSWLLMAQSTLHQQSQAIISAYDNAVTSAEATYQSQVASAASEFQQASTDAQQQRLSDKEAAELTHTGLVQAANSEYGSSVASAAQTRDDDIAGAQGIFNSAQAGANSLYQAAWLAATNAYDGVVASKNATFEADRNQLTSAHASESESRWNSYAADTDSYGAEHNDRVGRLQEAFNKAAKEADDEFKGVIGPAFNALQSAMSSAGLVMGGKEWAAWIIKQAKYTDYWTAETMWYMSQMMSGEITPFPEHHRTSLLQAFHTYAQTVASAAVVYAKKVGKAQLTAATADANGQSALAIAVANATRTLAIGSANAAYDFVESSAPRRETYLKAQAAADAALDKAVLDLEKIRDDAILEAARTRDLAISNAAQAQALTMAAAQATLENSTSTANHEYADAVADAGLAKAMAMAAANEQLENQMADADLAFINTMITATETYGLAVNTAAFNQEATTISAWYTGTAAMLQLQYQTTFQAETARATALAAHYVGNSDAAAAALHYQTMRIADAMARLYEGTTEAMATQFWANTANSAWLLMANATVHLSSALKTAKANAARSWVTDVAEADRTHAEDSANAAHGADIDDNAAAATAEQAEIGGALIYNLAAAVFSGVRERLGINADVDAALDEVDAGVTRSKKQADSNLERAEKEAEAEKATALSVAAADKQRAIDAANANADAVIAKAPADAAVMIANAKIRLKQSIAAAEAHVTQVNSRPPSHYEWELYSMQRGYDMALNTTTDFFVGWANSLTFGGYMKVLGDTTYLSQVDPNSTAFLAGSLVGSVHQMALGGAAGSGACQVGRLVHAVRNYGTAGSIIGVGQVAAKAWSEGASSLSVFDYLALAPVAGKIGGLMNRMCFVAGTPVAVGFESEANLIAAVPVDEAEATQEGSSGWNGLWLAAAAVVLAAQQVALQRKRRQQGQAGLLPVAVSVSPSSMLDESALLTWWSNTDEPAAVLMTAS